MKYRNPKPTVDAVILDRDSIILIKRKKFPFKNYWALPGGFIEYNEKAEDAVVREVKEETGLKIKIKRLIGVYSDPKRDPRGHTISTVYLCKIVGGKLKEGYDATEVGKFKIKKMPGLAFDHRKIINDAIRLAF